MGINIEHLNVKGNEFHDNAAVIRNETRAAESDESPEALRDLHELREQLEATSKAVAELEKAVQAKNKPKIRALAGKLTVGAAKSVITAVASDALLTWLKSRIS